MIFVSEAEHYVEIQHVSAEQWQSLVDELIRAIKAGETQQGLIRCIQSCGSSLAEHAPATGDKNELPNHLILL